MSTPATTQRHSPNLVHPVTARHVPVEQLEPSWHTLRHVFDAHEYPVKQSLGCKQELPCVPVPQLRQSVTSVRPGTLKT